MERPQLAFGLEAARCGGADGLGLFRALPLALALGLFGWALLAASGYLVYLLVT